MVNWIRTPVALLALAVTLAAPHPAWAQDDPLFDDEAFDDVDLGFPDPWEPGNRVMLRFNRGLDRLIFTPVTRVYRAVVPDGGRRAVKRAFDNIGSIPDFMNDVLQLRFRCGAQTAARFAVNSTAGLAGLYDVAASGKLVRHENDFGKTLARYGVPSGPYLVMPLFGPSTARDGFGTIVDSMASPATYFLGPAQQITYSGGRGLTLLDASYEALDALESSSVDFYASLRNAYYQARIGEIARTPACALPAKVKPYRVRAQQSPLLRGS